MRRIILGVHFLLLMILLFIVSCSQNQEEPSKQLPKNTANPPQVSTSSVSQHKKTTDCGFGAVSFFPNLSHFANGIIQSHWQYDYSPNSGFLAAYDKCVEIKKHDRFDRMPYISECFFRSSQDNNFNGMGVHARDGIVYRVRLHFTDDQNHLKIYQALQKRYGEPMRTGNYFEERFKHNLVEWKKETCRVVYDYGGVDKEVPTYLIFEKLPVFEGGFNPGHVNLHFLGVDQ